MQFITSITQKGQVSLPKSLRDEVGMEEYDKVIVERTNGYLQIKPLEDILGLAGTFKPKKKKSLEKARETFEKQYQRT